MRDNGFQAERGVLFDFEETALGAFSVNQQRRIVAWNASAERMLGYRAAEVVGLRCREVLRGCDGARQAQCRPDCALLNGLPGSTFEVHVSDRDGEAHWISIGTLTAQTMSGERRLVHLFRDVTSNHVLDESVARAMVASQEGTPVEAAARGIGERADSGGRHPTPLTARELEVVRLLACGLTTADIAETLHISRITARNHVTKVMDKLGARTQLQAIIIASRLKLV